MPVSPRVGAGLALAGVLIGLAALQAYSRKLDPVVQSYGTTYYKGEGPAFTPVACKPESEILSAITQVHAKYDAFEADSLHAFEERATLLKGFPPLNVHKLYVITEDDQLRDGQMVLFIGLRDGCVKTVFGLSAKVYREILNAPAGA
ncbi:MAG: hypothetical protein AB7G54_09555 [Methyloceanibacter sp.]